MKEMLYLCSVKKIKGQEVIKQRYKKVVLVSLDL